MLFVRRRASDTVLFTSENNDIANRSVDMSVFTSEIWTHMSNQLASSARRDFFFYLNAFWRVNLGMYKIKKRYSPCLLSVVQLACFIVCFTERLKKFAWLLGPTKRACVCNAQFTDVTFEAALSNSFRHFLRLSSKQLLILAVRSWAISVKICPLQFHRLRLSHLNLYCVSLTSPRSNNYVFSYLAMNDYR